MSLLHLYWTSHPLNDFCCGWLLRKLLMLPQQVHLTSHPISWSHSERLSVSLLQWLIMNWFTCNWKSSLDGNYHLLVSVKKNGHASWLPWTLISSCLSLESRHRVTVSQSNTPRYAGTLTLFRITFLRTTLLLVDLQHFICFKYLCSFTAIVYCNKKVWLHDWGVNHGCASIHHFN